MIRPIIALSLGLACSCASADEHPAKHFDAMAFLAGHCWKGAFPGGKATDEHCFEWVYDGKFMRDRHVVRGAGPNEYKGESLYAWDGTAGKVVYWYWDTEGGFSRGSMVPDGAQLSFPEDIYEDNGKRLYFRATWKQLDETHYQALKEHRDGETWKADFTIVYERQ